MSKQESVILVNAQDVMVGTMDKLAAHKKGHLHRAFSIFLFNSEGKFLLQQRAEHKYHSGLLWTNSCCSHPRPGESIFPAAKRRLEEELGIKDVDLKPLFNFTYYAPLDNALIEHEFDHILVGIYDGNDIALNCQEVMAYRYTSYAELNQEITRSPEVFTYWFLEIYKRVFEAYQSSRDDLKIH